MPDIIFLFNCDIWVDYTYLGHILLIVLQKVYKKIDKKKTSVTIVSFPTQIGVNLNEIR